MLRAGQVGLVKVLSCQKFREGVRLEILCGRRALDFYDAVYDQDRGIAQQLSVKPQDTLAAVERMEAELTAAKARMTQLEDQIIGQLAQEYEGRGDVVLLRNDLRPDAVRKLADSVARVCGGLAAVFSGEGDRYQYAFVRADGQDISALVKDMNKALQGRGGGRKGFAQGQVQATDAQIHEFLNL